MYARQPEGTAFVAIPQVNIKRQARALDDRRRVIDQRVESDAQMTNRIRIELYRAVVSVSLDVRSLREALELSQKTISSVKGFFISMCIPPQEHQTFHIQTTNKP